MAGRDARLERAVAVDVARKAGDFLLGAFCSHHLAGLRGSVKGAVTEFDASSDAIIRRLLQAQFLDDGLLTEEGEVGGSSGRRWIVDSLDGTANFAAKNPLWAVLVALEESSRVTLGVVHAPAIGETYIAERGKGAELNGQRIRVSQTKTLEGSYVYVCEGAQENRATTVALVNRMYPRVKDLRKIGSAGIEMAWVAAGRADGYVTTRIEPWDVAPGVLLVEEAGGIVETFEGTAWTVATHDIIVSNGVIQQELRTSVNA